VYIVRCRQQKDLARGRPWFSLSRKQCSDDMLLRTQLSSVFQIHLNKFDYYLRKTWMLRIGKTVVLQVADRIQEEKMARFQLSSAT